MDKKDSKYVQSQLAADTYLKIRDYATLHGYSLNQIIRIAVETFLRGCNEMRTRYRRCQVPSGKNNQD